MSYTVLARKWRPRTFAELVGQEHVARALMNGMTHGRVHHAFLFTGTRGVGKTTIARILAKCLNCEQGVTAEPCGVCASCREIDEGRFVDLLEVDAASRTKVDDTRALLDNVQYAPTRGRFKIYLIDEVHMLSNHSFNALLKTLEEPPEHVKFLLATTDPQKLPVTVLSRCLQFHLKRLSLPMIQGQLAHIIHAEGLQAEAGALALLARAADGSMRDALSLLDQAIAYTAGRLTAAEVGDMLGIIEHRHVKALIDALAAGDAGSLAIVLRELHEQSPDYEAVLDELAWRLQRIAAHQILGELERDEPDHDWLSARAQDLSPEDVQLYYQICLHGKRDLALAPDLGTGFEMTLLRMFAFRPMQIEQTSSTRESSAIREVKPSTPPAPAVPVKAVAAPKVADGRDDEFTAAPASAGQWAQIVPRLGLKGVTQQLAVHCTLSKHEGDRIELILDAGHANLCTPNAQARLQDALRSYFKASTLSLKITMGSNLDTPAKQLAEQQSQRELQARQAIEQDPTVDAFQQLLGAKVQAVKPLG